MNVAEVIEQITIEGVELFGGNGVEVTFSVAGVALKGIAGTDDEDTTWLVPGEENVTGPGIFRVGQLNDVNPSQLIAKRLQISRDGAYHVEAYLEGMLETVWSQIAGIFTAALEAAYGSAAARTELAAVAAVGAREYLEEMDEDDFDETEEVSVTEDAPLGAPHAGGRAAWAARRR